MAQLKWQESRQKEPDSRTGFSSAVSPWFGISMALIGVIVGYIIAMLVG